MEIEKYSYFFEYYLVFFCPVKMCLQAGRAEGNQALRGVLGDHAQGREFETCCQSGHGR